MTLPEDGLGDGLEPNAIVPAEPAAPVPAEPAAAETADPVPEEPEAPVPAKRRGRSAGRWLLFAALAIGILIADQLSKAWVTSGLDVGEGFEILGDWLRIVHWRNSGILFGMLPSSAGAFAIASILVAGAIIAYHARAGRGLLVTIALGLLLGGALGNLVDRLRYGSVIDFVDMGIGQWRFYTYNVADAAITTSIVLLLAMAIVPGLAEWAPDD